MHMHLTMLDAIRALLVYNYYVSRLAKLDPVGTENFTTFFQCIAMISWSHWNEISTIIEQFNRQDFQLTESKYCTQNSGYL